MRIFGTEVEEKYLVAFAAGSIFGGGFFYVAYKLLTRKRNVGRTFGKISNNNVDCEADLMLPVTLEKEYGNGRKVCISSDETASAFLKHLPENFFQFQEKFAQLISSTLTDKTCTRALIVGSKTGALAFNLSKVFTQVKGIERSFSQVVTCYRFQNLDNFVYQFPLEGSLKTANRTVVSPLLEQIASQTAAAFKKNKTKVI
ncbi:unnamed protein product [Orchesella dallaii]|uniref:Uncharacterized protein n=1 Tax=Orchesella dallaii TaxID=48710 RepID=A0ABP1RZ37_9HEXA